MGHVGVFIQTISVLVDSSRKCGWNREEAVRDARTEGFKVGYVP